MKEELKQWVLSEINNMIKLSTTPMYLYKKTLGTSHEITKHSNKKVSYLLDRLLSGEAPNGASSFYAKTNSIEEAIDLELGNNTKKIILWANKIGPSKDRPTISIETDILDTYIGYGVEWSKDKKHINYIKSKKVTVALNRISQDENGLKFRQSSAYPSFRRERNYPDAVITDKKCDGHDMVYEMMQTQAYKNAKTDAERQKLLSYVQRNDDSISGMGLPASKTSIAEENKALNRNVQLPPELQSHYEKQQSFNDIQRKTGETLIESRHVECSLKNNPSDESQYY